MFTRKKAQIGEVTHDFMAFIIAFFLIVLFFVVSLAIQSSNQNKLQQESMFIADSIRADINLQAMLNEKIDVNINGETKHISFVNLIQLAMSRQDNQEYKDKIKEFSDKIQKECKDNAKIKTNGCLLEIKTTQNGCPEKEKPMDYLTCALLPSNTQISITLFRK